MNVLRINFISLIIITQFFILNLYAGNNIEIIDIKGAVNKIAGEQTTSAIKLNSKINKNDRISTEIKSEIYLKLPDSTFASIYENSKIQLNKIFFYNTLTDFEFNIVSGRIFFKTGKINPESRFIIFTPFAEIILDTGNVSFDIQHNTKTTVRVLEGKVSVKNLFYPDKIFRIDNNRKIIIEKDKKEIKFEKFNIVDSIELMESTAKFISLELGRKLKTFPDRLETVEIQKKEPAVKLKTTEKKTEPELVFHKKRLTPVEKKTEPKTTFPKKSPLSLEKKTVLPTKKKPINTKNLLLKSILFPGLGQIYSNKKTKGIIFVCSEIVSLGMIAKEISDGNKYHSMYESASNTVDVNYYRSKTENHDSYRNTWIGLAAAVWFINIADIITNSDNETVFQPSYNNSKINYSTNDYASEIQLSFKF